MCGMQFSDFTALRYTDPASYPSTIIHISRLIPDPWLERIPGGASGKKNPLAKAGDIKDTGLIPRSGRSPGEGQQKPIPVFLPGESHWQRSLVGYSPWGHEELDTTEVTQQPWLEEVGGLRIILLLKMYWAPTTPDTALDP